jgi:hypothetical protein
MPNATCAIILGSWLGEGIERGLLKWYYQDSDLGRTVDPGGNVMQTRTRLPALFLALLWLGTAGASLADITLTIDQPIYDIGDIVHVTAHNNGPNEEQFLSDPFFIIYNDDTDECVFGCVGLPVVTPFPVGETVTMDYDTGFVPDIPGNYTIGIVVNNGPTINYVLNGPVAAEAKNWGAIKALYR